MIDIEKRRQRVREALQRRRNALREMGRCVDCGKNHPGNGHVSCLQCRIARSERRAKAYRRKKQQQPPKAA